jgi:multiple sugar transport system permease protein
MRPPLASILVNGLLIGLTLVSLFPLLWMVSVSFMQAGAATTLPPPLLPETPTLANYRELFLRGGMLRYLTNSLFLATAVTLGSLLFNTMAGYAFAKLQFAGRQRLFQALIGTLIIPGQVAMMPLFLLLKHMGL